MGAPQKIMPELPEVEITKRKLEPLIKSKRILNLGGKKILRIERKGKAILIYLSGGIARKAIKLCAATPLLFLVI